MIDRERIRKEFQLAQDIQKTFLPESLPSLPGWEISARWRLAQQVGGDFYDAFALGEDYLGLVIADVSDKGLPAALYMTVARTSIHAEALEGSSPSDTLQRVNELLLTNSREGLFVTCLYAVLNVLTGDFIYSNAGHNRALWLRKSRKEVVWMEKGGMPLGVMGGLKLKNISVQLKPKYRVVMYTDGVTELRAPDGTLFGEERFYNILNHYKEKPFPEFITALESKILDFRKDAPPSDDLTLLVLKRDSTEL